MLGARVGGRSERAGIVAAVEQYVLADEIPGVHAADEGANGTELRGAAEAAGGHGGGSRRLELGDRLSRGLRAAFHRLLEPVGVEGTGQQVVDRDVVRGDLAGHARDESREPGARAVRE